MEQKEKIEQIEKHLLKDIDELASVRKLPDYTNLAKYQRLANKIPEYIWKYAALIVETEKIGYQKRDGKWVSCRIEDAGLEIAEFSSNFVKSFEPDKNKGDTLNYLRKVIRQKIKHAGSEYYKQEARHGIRLSENKTDESVDRQFAELVKICVKEEKNIFDKETIEWLASQTGEEENKIEKLIEMHSFSVKREYTVTKKGETVSVFNLIESPDFDSEESAREKAAILEHQIKVFFEPIQKKYDETNSQPKKGGYLSALVTSLVLSRLEAQAMESKSEFSRIFFADVLQNYSFVDKALLENWKNGARLPADKQIAAAHGRGPTTASRLLADFKKIIKTD